MQEHVTGDGVASAGREGVAGAVEQAVGHLVDGRIGVFHHRKAQVHFWAGRHRDVEPGGFQVCEVLGRVFQAVYPRNGRFAKITADGVAVHGGDVVEICSL